MKKRSLYLLAGTLVLLFVGLIYAWSVFIAPLENLFNWNRGQTSHIFTLSMCMFCVGGMLSGYIIRKRSASFIIRCSAILMAIGFFLCSRTTSLLGIYVSYGVLCSLSVGSTYNAVLSTVVKWFPDKQSLCSGVLLMGFGAGGFLLGTVATRLIGSIGVLNAFIFFSVLSFIILILASFFIFSPNENSQTFTENIVSLNDVETKDMLKSSAFWLILLFSIFASASGLGIIGQASPIASSIGLNPQKATLAVGIISIFNGLGRVLMGYIFPKVKKILLLVSVCSSFIIAFILLVIATKNSNNLLIYLGFMLVGLSYGCIPSLGFSIIREVFGSKHYSTNLSMFNVNLVFAALLGSSVSGKIVQETGNYTYLVLMSLACIIVALILCFVAKNKIKN